MAQQSALVIGAGVAGIATAHYLALRPGIGNITIVDRGQPMAFTSAQSGENCRNWWPHPVMTAFTDLPSRSWKRLTAPPAAASA